MAMKTRILHTKFWYDQYISTLKSREKLLFVYLITNDRVNICGIYELPDKYIKADLDFTDAELNRIKKKFQKDNKFFFLDSWIRIINVDKYNRYLGIKNETARDRELELAPEKMIEYGCGSDTSIDTSMDRVSESPDTPIIRNHNHNQKSKSQTGMDKIRKDVYKKLGKRQKNDT